ETVIPEVMVLPMRETSWPLAGCAAVRRAGPCCKPPRNEGIMMGMRAVSLDKDGTLIEDVPYNVDPAQIRLLPGAALGLRALHDAGYQLFVVSNQSGVARGLFAEEALEPVERRLHELLADIGVPLSGFYYCPHHPEGVSRPYAMVCSCQKP